METIILVPGGGGSRLTFKGQEIWPPTLGEVAGGYQHLTELQDSRVKVAKIVDAVPKVFPCYQVYKPLQDDLNTIAKSRGLRRLDFPYDWRKDIFSAANKLASKITSCVNKGSTSVTLVCHSMGNLVARLVLESGDYPNVSDKITKYIGICGPHCGVPRILEYVLGLKDWLGISAPDMKTLSANPDFPSCYQCLPFQGDQALSNVHSTPPEVKDFYLPAVATEFDLSHDNLDAAKRVQAKLNFNNRPATAHYILIAGTDQDTDERVEYDETVFFGVPTDYLGDGTIPLRSAAIGQFNPYVKPGDHIGILKSYPFREVLYDVLTGGTLAPELTLVEAPGITLSLNSFTFAPHEPISVLIIPDLRTQEISGTLQITRVTAPEGKRFVRYQEQPVVYRGPQIGMIRSTISAPADPGAYRVTFSGSHGTSPVTAAGFVVSKVSVGQFDKIRRG